jgi:ABC-2 type transport system permease protein
MRAKKALIIFRKDWREVKRNWQVMLPVILLPVILAVILPVVVSGPVASSSTNQTNDSFLKNFPEQVRMEAKGMTDAEGMVYIMLLYFFAPFFLIIPLMASSVIAADSFAGEKERKTTEALLATPITDSELLLGKILVALVPAMIITIASFIVYASVVNIVLLPAAGRLVLPNLNWLILIFLLSPSIALAGIGLTVLISSRVKGFREAQQISGVLVLPVLFLVFAQANGALFLGPIVLLELTALCLIIDIAVLRICTKLFRREELIAKMN